MVNCWRASLDALEQVDREPGLPEASLPFETRPAQAQIRSVSPVCERTSLFGISALAISWNGSLVQCSGNVIDVDFLQRCDGLRHIVFYVRGKAEAADDRGHTFLMPEAACACLIALTTPRSLPEVNTTNPRPFRLKPVAISCWN
jgi:hypothetical protein